MNGSRYEQNPFGDYIESRLAGRRGRTVRDLFTRYRAMCDARSLRAFVEAACSISAFVDQHLDEWPPLLGGRVTPFSTFRGYFLEEVALKAAQYAVARAGLSKKLDVVKLPTGDGVVTGVSLAYRRGRLPQRVPIVFSRNREDVVVGYRRTLVIESGDGSHTEFPDELIPVTVLACKMYIDATRLENVLAKARSFYAQYSSCRLYVVAEWDALGQSWHDERGRVLDSLIAPVQRLLFLRGEEARRPDNSELRRASLARPYRPAVLRAVAAEIAEALEDWE